MAALSLCCGLMCAVTHVILCEKAEVKCQYFSVEVVVSLSSDFCLQLIIRIRRKFIMFL